MNEYTTPSAWQKWFGNTYNHAGVGYSMAAFSDLAAAENEYMSGKMTESNYGIAAGNLRTGAGELELRAAESANLLRKKYLAAAGNATYSAAARGADVRAGGVLSATLERSSMELNEDTAKIHKNAESKARSMRTQASIYEKMGKAYAKSSKYMAAAKLFGGLGSLGTGLAMFRAGRPNYNTGAAFVQSSTIGVGGVPMYGGMK